jgi:hypothetical protein
LYPAIRAAKVLGKQEKLYIVSVLSKVAEEVPVAGPLAFHVLEFEDHVPLPEECKSPLSKRIWEINRNYLGDEL